jgi:hypothetical protein
MCVFFNEREHIDSAQFPANYEHGTRLPAPGLYISTVKGISYCCIPALAAQLQAFTT